MRKIKAFYWLYLCCYILIACLGLLFSTPLFAQNDTKGLPFITNYRYQDYNADGVNWWAAEDDKGVMYFANTRGILAFDGQSWELIRPSGIGETRALTIGKDGKMYVATNGDIGYLAPGKKGKLEFISLKDKLPQDKRNFGVVWETNTLNDGNVLFRSNNRILIWDYKSFRVLESKEGFHVGALVGDKYYCRIWTRGLTILKNDSFHVVPNGEKFANERIYAILPFDKDQLLIGTRTQGLFLYDGKDFTPFKTEADNYIFNTSLYGGRILSNGLIAINTFNDGMVIIDKQGKLIQRIDKSVGLQDNSVDYVFEDSRGILWMPLFNGIAKLDLRSSLTYYNESMGLPSKTVFSVGSDNGVIYAGTNNGLFMLNRSNNRFEKLQGTGGQSGSNGFLKNGNDLLVSGAEKGLLKISGNKVIPVIPGVNYDFHLTQILRSKIDTTVLYCDLRNGLAIVRYHPASGSYNVESYAEGLSSSAGYFSETKNGDLWIAGDNPGELKLVKPDRKNGKVTVTEKSFTLYNYKQGLPVKNIFITDFEDKTYFYSQKDSVFIFDEQNDRFTRDTTAFVKNYIDPDADAAVISALDNSGNIWANLGTGVFAKLKTNDGSLKIIDAPFRELGKNYPVWAVTTSTDNNGKNIIWFAGREGIIRYDGDLNETSGKSFNTIIRGITLNEDSVYYSGYAPTADKAEFNHNWNSVRFQYSAPFFKQENETLFSTYLEGHDKGWSEWNKQTFREFGNLSAGTYTFRVKAKNIYDVESPEAAYKFIVAPPWYATWWAYALYVLAAVGIIYAIVRWRTRQLQEKHRELEKVVEQRTHELKQRAEELGVINSVQEGLVKELDMQAIYDMVGNKIRDVFDSQAVIIATFDQENKSENFKYVMEEGQRFYLNPRPYDKLRQHLITSKQKVVIHNLHEAEKWFGGSALPGTKPMRSGMFVPLTVGENVTGYISLQNVDKDDAFQDSDVRLLETLSNSMSVALENARLFDETNRLLKETEQRTAELAVINSVQEGLAKELDMQGIYDLVGDRLCELFPDTQTLVIRTFEHETGLEHFKYAIEKGVHLDVNPQPFMWANKSLIETKKPIDIRENYVETSKMHGGTGVTKGQPPKSAVFVPMMVGDVVKGSISLQNVDKEHAFSDSDLRLLTTITNSMSVALENARLFDETNRLLKETEQRTAELAVINSVQEGLAKELDMKGIYELIGDRLCKLFPDTQTLVIRTFDHQTGFEHWQYAIEKGERGYVQPRPFNWNSKQLISTKKPLDIRKDYVETAKMHGGTGVVAGQSPKSAVFVPMMVGDAVKGSVSLQNVDKENAFTDSDLRLLTTITNSMSVALENARLFDETNRLLKETEQRTAELAVINSVQEGLVREMNMQAIYDLVGHRICDLFDTQTVLIRTFDLRTEMEHWQFVIEKGQRHYSNPRPIIWANKLLIKSKQPLLINENYVETAQKHGSPGVSKGLPPKSALFVPMIVGDVVKGSVSLQNVEKENAFTDSDLRLLTTLTNSMSVALENARLFDESNRLLAEAKQRAAELSTVNSISKALASQLNADDLIKMVGDQLKDLFRANIVYLALLNPKTRIINFPYQYGDNMAPLKLGEGLTSKIILNGEPLLINKDLQELRLQMGIQQIGVPAASYLGVPIPVGEENIGVLSVQSTESENRFNENDLRLLSTIASSVGVALNNATLFEDVRLAKMEAEASGKAAEKANEAKSAFLSTVSHELRTPLTSVLGFAKIIRKRLEEKIFPIVDKKDPKTEKTIGQISENLHVVISEGERLTHLINDVLDLAKIEAGKMEWNQESVSISEVAERAIAATSSLFDQKALKLVKNIDADLPAITGDRDKLIQVIINLISNSVKFTDKGSVTCTVSQKKDEIVVSISDTGIGIAPGDFGAVFEQFKQVGGDTLTDKPKGTGLGLPICKEIVEHHGGRIWLESEVGKGSTFSFALPVTKTNGVARPMHLDDLVKQLKEQVAQSHINIIGKASTILIVDDDDSIRSLLQQELGDAGYSIEEARNGKEALAAVRKQRPDLIILDIMMPEMNGFDVAAVLKNDPQTMDIPIIVLSIVQDKTRGFRIGVDRYLTKPIDTGLLFSEIGSLLEQGKSKKKVMVVDQDIATVNTLTEVLKTKGYSVMEANEKELLEKAIANQPDIIIINSVLSGKQDIVQTIRFEKGLENVLFLVYQ